MDAVDVDVVRITDSPVGAQRARLSVDVVAELKLPLGAPVRIRLFRQDVEFASYLCALEPWDRPGRCCEIDGTIRERGSADAAMEATKVRMGQSTERDGCADRAVVERMESKPIACERLRLSSSRASREEERRAIERALRERVVREGCAARASGGSLEFTCERVEPRCFGDEGRATWRVTTATNFEHVGPSDSTERCGGGVSSPRAEMRVAACEEALQALRQLMVWPLRHGEEARKLGVKFPRGLLLHGPPGTGKTEAVRAVSAEAGAETLTVSSGDVAGAYAGESEKRLRKVFERARKLVKKGSPCVIVIDELDAMCPTRRDGNAHEARVVAQLLTLMDGAGESSEVHVPVVATTSRPNAIDPALRRPGRFDREIEMSLPNLHARAEIVKLHAASMPLADDVDLCAIAAESKGYSGADLAALCREAAMRAIQRRQTESTATDEMTVTMADFQQARSRVRASVVRGVALDLPPVTWDDIGGLDEVKKRLKQAVEWPLHHADAFNRLGLRPPKGVLLHGPPGCAKTSLARAAATASGATVIALTAADVFSKYLGEGEKLLRSTFDKARKSAPAVLLLDEIDGMCGSRGGGTNEGANDVATRLLSVFLTEMDGLEGAPSTGAGVLVVATTNRPQSLDPALTRPGRLDLVLEIPPLDLQGRIAALRVHTRDVTLADDVDLESIARDAVGYSGAELRHVVKEAALAALREDMRAERVHAAHFIVRPKS